MHSSFHIAHIHQFYRHHPHCDTINCNSITELPSCVLVGNKHTVYSDQPVSSKSPPTRDKLHPEGKIQARIRNRNRTSLDATDAGKSTVSLHHFHTQFNCTSFSTFIGTVLVLSYDEHGIILSKTIASARLNNTTTIRNS